MAPVRTVDKKEAEVRLVRFLVEARRASTLSQAQMATALGLGQPDISKIERLERRIDTVECLNWLLATSAADDGNPFEVWRALYSRLTGSDD